jgi:DNA-binding response OmpR family regulator
VRIAVVVPDPEFGSQTVKIVQDAGHDPELTTDIDGLVELLAAEDFAAIVADLSVDGVEWAEALADVRPDGVPVLACFPPIEPDVRAVALEVGLDQVVPRSRLAREGGTLLNDLLDDK